MLSRRDNRDAGFTLIELLVAIVILGLIMAPLAGVVIGYLKHADGTVARLGESHDQQLVAAYWQQDVSSIGVRSSTYDTTAHTFPLLQSVYPSSSCTAPGLTQLVVLAWNQYDASGAAIAISVAYARNGNQLHRLHCTGSTVDSNLVLARELDPAVAPSVACSGAGGSSCTGAGSNVPATISLGFGVKDPSGAGKPYSVTLTGQRRQT